MPEDRYARDQAQHQALVEALEALSGSQEARAALDEAWAPVIGDQPRQFYGVLPPYAEELLGNLNPPNPWPDEEA